VFGIETRAWSLATSASPRVVEAVLGSLPEPRRREWLAPGALAPLVRARRDENGAYLRLSPGDPRRGPGSADRFYLQVAAAGTGTLVTVSQRPVRWLQLTMGTAVVGLWAAAAVAAAYALTHASPAGLAGVPVVLAARTLTEAGRRLDERRLRGWLTARLQGSAPTARPAAAVAYGPARYDVPAGDCV
jgi:hypothetical protein